MIHTFAESRAVEILRDANYNVNGKLEVRNWKLEVGGVETFR